MEITTVTKEHSEDFTNAINKLLKENWNLHGEPNIQTTSHQDTWDGRLRTWSKTTYTQVLSK
mgnify:CR=1 FL=1